MGKKEFLSGHFQIPEVLILFRDKLFRGNRCMMFENNGFNCVSSPNFPCLAQLQSNIEISWDFIVKIKKKRKFAVFKVKIHLIFSDFSWFFQNFCNKIAHIKLQPLCFIDLLENLLKTPDLKALIIESYGHGTVSFENPRFIALIKAAISRGLFIVNISQCYRYNMKDSEVFLWFLIL